MECKTEESSQNLKHASRYWLFLDYDGTLADFAPTPDHVEPDPELISLIADLARQSEIRLALVSGRSLAAIKQLLPVHGLLAAGTYGIELVDFEGLEFNRLDISATRPALDSLKPRLEALIDGRQGFYLEDKGWALALHARFASEEEAESILIMAERLLREECSLETYQILNGQRFLEICPLQADKGQTVAYLLDRYPWPGALPVYLGDDDKDEKAFRVINDRGGISIRVGTNSKETLAQCSLASPREVRDWLRDLVIQFEKGKSE